MLNNIICFSIQNRLWVLLLSALLGIWGMIAIQNIKLDALPDLSDVQVVLRISYPGQTPQLIENQVTFPLTSQLMSISEAEAVRGFSMLGDAYVYVIFADGTDYDWARARVLEYVNQITPKLPKDAEVLIGPEASGVSWVYQYALLDKSGQHDLSDLRRLQDWYLKYELQTVPGVAEVAAIGGMVRQYQVVIDPKKQRAYNIPLADIEQAIRAANQESSGSVIELGEAEYAVHASGYIESIHDLALIPVATDQKTGSVVLLKDIAQIRLGPKMRRGIAELDGEGEVVGGIVVMRAGENPLQLIERLQQKLQQLQHGLPKGVEIVTTYDRSQLILRAINHLTNKLWQESLLIALVCALFLWHWRSALVAVISLPLGILMAFIIMRQQGIEANIMSLGGIAIALGAMVDAAIVMIENLHKHLQQWAQKQGRPPSSSEHWQLVQQASIEVGPALFFSLLIITLSFLPVLLLEAEEGRLFAPLAYTKTYAMAAAAALAVTLIPVLMGYWIRGRIQEEQQNPLLRFINQAYRPALEWALQQPKKVFIIVLIMLLSMLWPLTQLKHEFMPQMDEGDLLYMPTTFPGISIGKAQQLLQQTDALIKSVPEVKQVFGKIGRAETATDPAPLSMIETTIQLKPRSEWRTDMTLDKLITELDETVSIPGLTNAWVQPIKTRIDMLSTGIRTPLGIKITGADLAEIERIGKDIEALLKRLPSTRSVFSDRSSQGRYIHIKPDRAAAAKLGVPLAEIHRVVRLAIGGSNITETVDAQERYGINLRYPHYARDSLQKLQAIPVILASGKQVPLLQLADISIIEAPANLKSENARLASWVMIDIQNTDLLDYIRQAEQMIDAEINIPATYHVSWTGDYESIQRVNQRLWLIVPLVLLLAGGIVYFIFRSVTLTLISLLSLPFALIGGFWFVWLLGFKFSVAVSIGFIALLGVAMEFSIIMLLYLEQARKQQTTLTQGTLYKAVIEGALTRLRPKLMTMSVIIAGLWLLMLGQGSGADVMQRIAAPMLGGMLTAPLLSMFIIPCWYYQLLLRKV